MCQEKNKKDNLLQGYRAIACLMVYFSHAFGMYGLPIEEQQLIDIGNSLFHLLYDGSIAVKMFWVLGGYLAASSFKKYTLKDYIYYILKKLLRLYPMYFISLLFGMILCNIRIHSDLNMITDWGKQFWNTSVSVQEILKQLVFRGNPNSINPPTWTMKYEVCMVFVLPIIIMILATVKRTNLVGIIIIVASMICGWKFQISELDVLVIFMFGVMWKENENGIAYAFHKWYKYRWGIVILFILILDCRNIHWQGWSIPVSNLVEYMTAFGVLGLLISVKNKYISPKVIGRNVLTFIGNISYEIYLLHFLILLSMRCYIINEWMRFLVTMTALIITVGVSYVLKKVNDRIYIKSIRILKFFIWRVT